MDIRYRLARCRYFLFIYNRLLRHAPTNRCANLLRLMEHMWERMGEGERQFILAREEW